MADVQSVVLAASAGQLNALIPILENALEELRNLTSCKICVRPMYEPYTIKCGHTFCYSCLVSWFEKSKKNKTCPTCRAKVTEQPAPAYLVREITQVFTNRAELMVDNETTAEHQQQQAEESAIVEKDKTSQVDNGGLFRGCFPVRRPEGPIRDLEDGVERCPACSWELEDGWCDHCSRGWDDEDELVSVSDRSTDTEDDIGDDDNPPELGWHAFGEHDHHIHHFDHPHGNAWVDVPWAYNGHVNVIGDHHYGSITEGQDGDDDDEDDDEDQETDLDGFITADDEGNEQEGDDRTNRDFSPDIYVQDDTGFIPIHPGFGPRRRRPFVPDDNSDDSGSSVVQFISARSNVPEDHRRREENSSSSSSSDSGSASPGSSLDGSSNDAGNSNSSEITSEIALQQMDVTLARSSRKRRRVVDDDDSEDGGNDAQEEEQRARSRRRRIVVDDDDEEEEQGQDVEEEVRQIRRRVSLQSISSDGDHPEPSALPRRIHAPTHPLYTSHSHRPAPLNARLTRARRTEAQ